MRQRVRIEREKQAKCWAFARDNLSWDNAAYWANQNQTFWHFLFGLWGWIGAWDGTCHPVEISWHRTVPRWEQCKHHIVCLSLLLQGLCCVVGSVTELTVFQQNRERKSNGLCHFGSCMHFFTIKRTNNLEVNQIMLCRRPAGYHGSNTVVSCLWFFFKFD